jgi:hypothetical protein
VITGVTFGEDRMVSTVLLLAESPMAPTVAKAGTMVGMLTVALIQS